MSIPTAIVPDGMSYVNAWYALYTQIDEVEPFAKVHPESLPLKQEMVATSDRVVALFRQEGARPTNYPFYMEYAGGKRMKVHFCEFPKLDVYYYDQSNGAGAAQRALDSYNAIPSAERFDANDRCQFQDLLAELPERQQRELSDLLARNNSM